ncbi:hypothetical protein BCR34DRAFT_496307, partial [Clohesyomyces aquaticus]
KIFLDHQVFMYAVDLKVGPTPQYNCLGKIQLNLTNKGYFEFFGVELDPNLHVDQSKSKGHHLTRLGALYDLQIRFRCPRRYEGKPVVPSHWLYPENGGLCMTFTFPYIKQIKKVNLTGFVKKPSKDKWEAILANEAQGKPHSRDQDAAMAAISVIPKIYCQFCPRDPHDS